MGVSLQPVGAGVGVLRPGEGPKEVAASITPHLPRATGLVVSLPLWSPLYPAQWMLLPVRGEL